MSNVHQVAGAKQYKSITLLNLPTPLTVQPHPLTISPEIPGRDICTIILYRTPSSETLQTTMLNIKNKGPNWLCVRGMWGGSRRSCASPLGEHYKMLHGMSRHFQITFRTTGFCVSGPCFSTFAVVTICVRRRDCNSIKP